MVTKIWFFLLISIGLLGNVRVVMSAENVDAKQMNVVFLASSSQERANILGEARIEYQVLGRIPSEDVLTEGLDFIQCAEQTAQLQMKHVILPEVNPNTIIFVITAKSLCQNADGTLIGRPKDEDKKEDGRAMIKSCRNGRTLATAFCIAKKLWDGNVWCTLDQRSETVLTEYEIHIPDEWIDFHIDFMNTLRNPGGATVRGFGQQFLKLKKGSYQNILGMPMFEIRNALIELGFVFNYAVRSE